MKRNHLLLLTVLFLGSATCHAVEHTITISGLTYAPASVNANVGDIVHIAASSTHPLVQVDQSTWDSNGSTPMPSGWGTQTSEFTFTIQTLGDIYYVCANHVGSSMKGMITVSPSTGITGLLSGTDADVFPSVSKGGRFTVRVGPGSVGSAQLDIHTLSGSLVRTFKLKAETTVLTTGLASGSYVFLIGNEDGVALRKKVLVVRE